MKVASLMCTYIYGSLSVIKAAIEGYRTIAKSILKRIDAIAQAAMTVARYTIDVAINTMINLVKTYEKQLIDMLYDSIFGTDKSFWCNRLWKCLALVNELLDPDSWLFRKLNEWWKRQCKDASSVNSLLENIREIVSDFQQFQQTVCSAGFTVDFGVSYIKQLLNYCKEQIETYLDWVDRQIKRIKLLCEEYLNTLIDWGFMDYLDSLMSFFTCVFDDSVSCSEIATASNFYNDTLAKMKLKKDGDGYTLSDEYRNSLYGGLEGTRNRLSNLKMDIDNATNKCVDPKRLKRAEAAYNLSQRLLPHDENGHIDWGKIKSGEFSECPMWKNISATKDQLWEDIHNMKLVDGSDKTMTFGYTSLEDGTRLGADGYIYYKDGCSWKKGNYMATEKDSVLVVGDPDYDIIFDGDKPMTILEAAYEIQVNPNSDFSKECISLHEFINSWKYDTGLAVRYAKTTI